MHLAIRSMYVFWPRLGDNLGTCKRHQQSWKMYHPPPRRPSQTRPRPAPRPACSPASRPGAGISWYTWLPIGAVGVGTRPARGCPRRESILGAGEEDVGRAPESK